MSEQLYEQALKKSAKSFEADLQAFDQLVEEMKRFLKVDQLLVARGDKGDVVTLRVYLMSETPIDGKTKKAIQARWGKTQSAVKGKAWGR